jgi:predicted ATPase
MAFDVMGALGFRLVAKSPAAQWPIPASAFVGRHEELAALGDFVECHRLVTVLGAPGIGKTRVTLEWLRRESTKEGAFPGGVRFCDLSDTSSVEEVVRLVAKELRVALTAGVDANIGQLGAAIAGCQKTLLVLDHFEHVLEVAHPLVTAWLGQAPQAHFLLTSRERLKLEGEHVFELGPLHGSAGRDDAVALFEERAKAVGSVYPLADGDLTVRELVDELDRNPLAIELAAARTRVLSPKEILDRMPQRFEVLVSDRRGQPRRSVLLEAIEESWNLLPDWGQAALTDCAVFRGGFDLTSAEQVLALEAFPNSPSVVDALESLCDKSLVAIRRTAVGLRFALHASIRAYVVQCTSDPDRAGASRTRHALHFTRASEAWATELRGKDAPRALDQLRVEAENLTAALRFLWSGPATAQEANGALTIAITLASILAADGPFVMRAWALEEAISFADRTAPDPALVVEALDASVLALVAIGRPADSRANAERACAMAKSLGDTLLGRALSTLGLSFGMEGNAAEATRCLDDSLVHLRRARAPLYEGRVLGRFAWLEWMTGQLESARRRFQEALTLHRAVGDRTFEAMNSGYLAVVAHELGDLETPLTLLEHAIAEQQRLGHRRVEADLTSALGSLFHERGALDEARTLHRRALEIYRRVGHSRDHASLLADIAKVDLDEGCLNEARSALVEALPLAKATGNALTIGEAEALLGVICAHQGKLDESYSHLEAARNSTCAGPRGIELVELMQGHLDVAEARAAFDRGDPIAMAEHLAAARVRLAAGTAVASGGSLLFRERRLAVATLTRVIEEAATWGSGAGPSDAPSSAPNTSGEAILSVFPVQRSLLTPEGTSMELERHPALWRLVDCLLEAHELSPGQCLSVDNLVAAGWPDERVRGDAGARRVYTALSTLRRRGLRAWIVKREEGYGLAPHVQVVFHR